MAQMLNSIQGTITANGGTVGPVGMLNANVTMLVTGTWAGSVALQARVCGDPNNAWALISTARTTNGISNVAGIAGDMEFRAVCTAYTSGTITVYIGASPSS